MQLFYQPNIDNSAVQFAFNKEESRHLIKVLRRKEGDTVFITNGKGDLYTAKIIAADVKMCKAEIIERKIKHRKMHWLHLAVAPTKSNDRFEWFLEKATEIGIQEITPIYCEHSERTVLKMERLEKVIQAAMKQSLRTYLPKLNEPISLQAFLEQEHKELKFIAHCEEEDKLDLKRCIAADKDVTILIGPEGDFSSKEIKMASNKGFLPISLGEARLRTETAALVACTAVAIINSGS
ncbi:16S rRNA (uracil(1498)-N(3))-methyltransferase [Eudoraea chungangensis]|uniref:16S rRNA (uracil(1498)-N(3))-methyltransferase n=1 Tax=Eudoraea chungangensis TaxID=1481905 RepID=UPI0023ED155C|nr:16S rRNA (uracil(1498)-N(3))-methyltransferase [Eudoraea chungangensis]